jgi:tetratricopeptide (TPR) repeat protein
MKSLLLLTAIVGWAFYAAAAQDSGVGRRIYSENAPSVLLLYVRSLGGNYIAQGSGFLIGGSRIVTNAHVANGGRVYVELGAARIPTKLEKMDSLNDLAILSVEAEMTTKPLQLAEKWPSPGEIIFAITNPEGLERTITQGVVSANRELDGRKLLQISTPISHGSSGGPIFNSDGMVVGIAVGTLADGQNLNFAIPVELLRDLVKRAPSSPSDLESILGQITTLQVQQAQEKYSTSPDSGYQRKQGELETLLNRGSSVAGNNPDALLKIAKIAAGISTDIAVAAARRAADLRPSPDSYLLLANVLNAKYTWLQGEERQGLMKEGEKAARLAIKTARSPTAEMYFRLGDTLEDESQYVEAESVLRNVLNLAQSDAASDLYFQAVRDMVLCADGLHQPGDEKRWFGELEKRGQAGAYDWHSHAARLVAAAEYKDAGDAYSRAATTIKGDWCSAGIMYDAVSDADSSLSADRKCIEALTGTSGSEVQLAGAHQSLASTLNDRGVYSEALSHAKEATTLDPSNAWAFSTEADALNYLQRFNEAINASKEAIRLSDGKFSSMHFTLGTSYFKTENWELARQSFQKAAELNPKDDAAAYNVAVCYARLGYYNDAAHWYEEALRRNPSRDDKDELRHRIEILRR